MRIRLRHNALRRRIALSRMSQNRWALKLGVSSGHLSELINGKHPYPSARTRDILLRGLGATFEDLFEVEDKAPSLSQVGSSPRHRVRLFELRGGNYRLRLERSVPRVSARRKARMHSLGQDLRFGLRMLMRKPTQTVTILIALALGIGGTTAVFSLVDGVLLRPIPIPEADRVAELWEVESNDRSSPGRLSYPNLVDVKEEIAHLEGAAVLRATGHALTTPAGAVRIEAARVSSDFFGLLKVESFLGRFFVDSDDLEGAGDVAVISHGFWRRHLGARRESLGERIELDGLPHSVIGVLPAGFRFLLAENAEVWTPLARDAGIAAQRGMHAYLAVARLAAGSTWGDARSSLSALAGRLAEQYREQRGRDFQIAPIHRRVVEPVRPALLALLASIALVLLIACANVANLLLAQSSARQRELAVRSALGAGRARLVAQMVSESLLLSLAGGALGLALAAPLVGLAGRIPFEIPQLSQVTLDIRVFLFALTVALVTGLVFGLPPALMTVRHDLQLALNRIGRGTVATGGRLRTVLVAGETVLAVVLLVGTGLCVRSFVNLMAVEPGYDPRNVVTFALSAPLRENTVGPQRAAYYQRVTDALAANPGVVSVAGATSLPLDSKLGVEVTIAGSPSDAGLPAWLNPVSPGYFETMAIRMQRGRSFTSSDRLGAPGVAVINQTMAQRYFPQSDPLGRRVDIGVNFAIEGEPSTFEVVGVVDDIHQKELGRPVEPEIYICHLQQTWPMFNFLLRTRSGDLEGVSQEIQRMMSAIERSEPTPELTTLEDLRSGSLSPRRFATVALASFSLLALALTLVGVYGVVSCSVVQRTREIGVRMALGACARDIIRMVLSGGLIPVGGGLIAGVGLALAATRVFSKYLFKVTPFDWPTYLLTASFLGLSAVAACYLPARRASRADPLSTLREE